MSSETMQNSPNYIPMMVLISKVFFISIQIEIAPYLLQPGKMAPWVQLFCSILETELPIESTTQTESWEEILQLNKQPCWVLKGVVGQITLKLF